MSDDAKYPSQLAERFQVRMPDGLRDRIAESAKRNNRSMNAEIVQRLEQSFDLGALPPMTNEQLKQLRAVLAALLRTMDNA